MCYLILVVNTCFSDFDQLRRKCRQGREQVVCVDSSECGRKDSCQFVELHEHLQVHPLGALQRFLYVSNVFCYLFVKYRYICIYSTFKFVNPSLFTLTKLSLDVYEEPHV